MPLIPPSAVVSTAVRLLTLCLLSMALLAACAQSPQSPPATVQTAPQSTQAGVVDPGRIRRMRGEFPAGYEVADAASAVSPADFWGFRSGWTAQPPPCAALVHPVDGGVGQGLSASGDGGLLYVVAASAAPAAAAGPVPLDPVLLADCAQWTMAYGRSSATVDLIEAPRIDGADTVGMSSMIRTVVESGTETDSQAQTFTAYLGGYFVFVTLIVDPGSAHPPLPASYAADLLVKTVTALRG